MNKRVLGIVLVLAASMAFAAVAPAFAENLHVPEGAKIFYFTGGQSGEINLPSDYPLNQHPWHADKMRIYALHIEGGNAFMGDEIVVWFHLAGSPPLNGWAAWANFITSDNPDDADWLRQFWYALPPSDSVNTASIPSDDLVVDRHGNSITVSLKTPQQMVAHLPFTVWPVLPAFDMELNKVDGSVHPEPVVWTNTGLPPVLPGSGWTSIREEIGFNGNGVFTCDDLGYHSAPMTDCFIVMHGIETYIPPPEL
jgi:hypothetical protein